MTNVTYKKLFTEASLKELTITQLATVYNLKAQKPVKKFVDKETAVSRVMGLLEQYNLILGQNEDGFYFVNGITDEGVEAFKDIREDAHAAPAQPEPKKPAGGRRGPAPEFADDEIITVLAANPKREGTKAYAMFELYKDGLTVAEFLAAGGRRVDLRWDADHGFINITKEG